LVWAAYVVALFASGLGLTFTLVGMIPLMLMWLDRVTSAWRVPGRSWRDLGLAAVMVVEDAYGLFLEACTAVAIVRSFRRIEQAW